MKRSLLLALALVLIVAVPAAAPAAAQEDAPLSCTVSLQALAIEVDPTSVDYGVTTHGATIVSPEVTLTNSGNVVVDVAVRGDDATCATGTWLLDSGLLDETHYQHLIEGLVPARAKGNLTKVLTSFASAMEPDATATLETTIRIPIAGCPCGAGEEVGTVVTLVATASA